MVYARGKKRCLPGRQKRLADARVTLVQMSQSRTTTHRGEKRVGTRYNQGWALLGGRLLS